MNINKRLANDCGKNTKCTTIIHKFHYKIKNKPNYQNKWDRTGRTVDSYIVLSMEEDFTLATLPPLDHFNAQTYFFLLIVSYFLMLTL